MLITFEGCEGCGKTTQLALLKEYLENRGIPCVFSREPGGSEIAEKIRGLLLDAGNSAMTADTEALLYAAARAQHLHEIVEPALKDGKLVILDRYIDSSFAYQGFARGLGFKFIYDVNSVVVNKFMPDLTIIFNITPEQAFARKHGPDSGDRLEQAGMEFHNKVYEGYQVLKDWFPRRVVFIPAADAGPDVIHQRVLDVLKERGII